MPSTIKFSRLFPRSRRGSPAWLLLAALSLFCVPQAVAQSSGRNGGIYEPLDQNAPLGMAAQWALLANKQGPTSQYFQPVRIELPGEGKVTFFEGSAQTATMVNAPAQPELLVGHSYRFRISHMPELPGIELFPTIEILDRLHPPIGRQAEFPVPVQFTREELEVALNGRLVTKVVYLEQPQFAAAEELQHPITTLTLRANQNLLAEADQIGRPMLIVRLGGRIPSALGDEPHFFGSGAPVSFPVTQQPLPKRTP